MPSRPSRRACAAALAALVVAVAAQAQAPAPAPAPADTSTVPRAVRRALVDSVLAGIERTYVDADTARLIVAHLRERARRGAYDTTTTARAFAGAVTRDLRAINGDLHLSLRHDPRRAAGTGPLPRAGAPRPPAAEQPTSVPMPAARVPGQPTPAPDVPPEMRTHPMLLDATRGNFGLSKVEILPGNVGYLEVAGFFGAPGAENAIDDALRFLERTDAIVIDLRRNPGGSSVMSHLVASHFLPAVPQPTVRVRAAGGAPPVTLTTFADVPGPRRTDVPLYLLTSRRTASAAEEFAFILRNAGRAVLVGEPTAGAGHMVEHFAIGHGFVLGSSITRVADPRTGQEWERVGVAPHVTVAADKALDAAHAAALTQLAQRAGDAAWRGTLESLASAASARAR